MDFVRQVYEAIRHLSPDSINGLAHTVGPWLYVVLFLIIFAETGLVLIPFLPGDSLLFAVGAVAAMPDSPINLPLAGLLLVVAAVVGDAVNYAVGFVLGPRVFQGEKGSWLLNRKHLAEAQRFYEKHGGKTIILARFVPIVRTFAPFVAGVGRMNYGKFAAYNVVGGLAWVGICLGAGRAFGGIKFVRERFELVILGIIFVSVLPAAIEIGKGYLASRKGRSGLVAATTFEPNEGASEPPLA